MLVSNFLLTSMVNIIKTLILGKTEGSRQMGVTEDEMVG